MNPLTLVLRVLIRAYQWVLSPVLPASCRFAPTCSDYALQAIAGHGPIRGGWLAVRRLARCHPWGGAGWDPVPPVRACGHQRVRGSRAAGEEA